MSENAALDRFIETAKENFKASDASILEYPNVKLQKLLLIEITVPKKFHKTEELTLIAEALAPLANRKVIDGAEAFVANDGRISINVAPKKVA
jgi:hypothetical protein